MTGCLKCNQKFLNNFLVKHFDIIMIGTRPEISVLKSIEKFILKLFFRTKLFEKFVVVFCHRTKRNLMSRLFYVVFLGVFNVIFPCVDTLLY